MIPPDLNEACAAVNSRRMTPHPPTPLLYGRVVLPIGKSADMDSRGAALLSSGGPGQGTFEDGCKTAGSPARVPAATETPLPQVAGDSVGPSNRAV